jgi:hypothetical protein
MSHMPVGGTGYSIASPNAYTNTDSIPLLVGTPVYASGSSNIARAQANAIGTAIVIGLVAISPSIGVGLAGPLQGSGVFTMPTAAWDAICGTSGGLTYNTVYYLSPTTAGFFTSTAPTTVGQFVVPVLVGLSPTQAQITLIPPIAL